MNRHSGELFLSRLPRWSGAVILVVSCALSGAPACRRAPDHERGGTGLSAQTAQLERSNVLLERQLELAGGKDFYLLLDPAASDLTLMLRAAELRRFPVLGLQVGYPRISWFSRRVARVWQGVIWSEGELVPPRPIDRIVVTAEERAKGEEEPPAPPIPPTAEELYKVPSQYLVRFSDGLSIEIRPRESDVSAGRVARFRAWWSTKWSNVAAALGSSSRDAIRLRILLNPNDADSLYRSLPPSVRLLILPGEPARR
jgi:hypothetical protein